MLTLTRTRFLAGAAAATILPSAARAQTAKPLRMNVFPGVDAWPMYVIADKGLLARDGFSLEVTATQGSVAQFQHMLSGDADLALTALDNVIAYDAGQGDPAVTGTFDFAAYIGLGSGGLKLLVRPDVSSYQQLRNATFAVDAPGTGYSFVLRRILQVNGLPPGSYSFAALGNTQKRFEAMVAGQCAGGMVASPFDLLGQQQYGFRVLTSALAVLGHYEATVVMARRSWTSANAPTMTAFVRAYRAARAWLYDRANRSEAGAILAKNAHFDPPVVAQCMPLLDAPDTFSPDGTFDRAGVQTVLTLRSTYATPSKQLGPPDTYIDERFLH